MSKRYEIRKEQALLGLGPDVKAIYDDDGSYVGEIRKEQTWLGFGPDIDALYVESNDETDSSDKGSFSVSEYKRKLIDLVRESSKYDASQKKDAIAFFDSRRYDPSCACKFCKGYEKICYKHGYSIDNDENNYDRVKTTRDSEEPASGLEALVVTGLAAGLFGLIMAACNSSNKK